MADPTLIPCIGCGGLFPPHTGPTHKYMQSSAACWHRYGTILAREYSNPDLFKAAHRLTVDAYALQHPGDLTDRRAVKSVYLHYVSLYLILEKSLPHDEGTKALQDLTLQTFETRPQAPRNFSITIANFDFSNDDKHERSSHLWARTAFDAWNNLRDQEEWQLILKTLTL